MSGEITSESNQPGYVGLKVDLIEVQPPLC